jgi:hypothetical protein
VQPAQGKDGTAAAFILAGAAGELLKWAGEKRGKIKMLPEVKNSLIFTVLA